MASAHYLVDLEKKRHLDLWGAVKAYNGTGKRAADYEAAVQAMAIPAMSDMFPMSGVGGGSYSGAQTIKFDPIEIDLNLHWDNGQHTTIRVQARHRFSGTKGVHVDKHVVHVP